jgi:hypothetical protein
MIHVQHSDGTVTATKDTDRKPIVLERIRHYLRTGDPGRPTCIPARFVREDGAPAELQPNDRLYYRWYSRAHKGVLRLLGDLTGGRFADGAVARVLIMDYWTRGEVPTIAEFAQAWTKAKAEEHKLLTPEYAYLTDLKHGQAGTGWKALRTAKARAALQTLAKL